MVWGLVDGKDEETIGGIGDETIGDMWSKVWEKLENIKGDEWC